MGLLRTFVSLNPDSRLSTLFRRVISCALVTSNRLESRSLGTNKPHRTRARASSGGSRGEERKGEGRAFSSEPIKMKKGWSCRSLLYRVEEGVDVFLGVSVGLKEEVLHRGGRPPRDLVQHPTE